MILIHRDLFSLTFFIFSPLLLVSSFLSLLRLYFFIVVNLCL
jgi:hypothetical protein